MQTLRAAADRSMTCAAATGKALSPMVEEDDINN